MELSQQNLEEALRLLGNLLAIRKGAGFWLVVCGGSALLAHAQSHFVASDGGWMKCGICYGITFIRLGRQRAVEAFRLQQGARFLEELLLDTILAERAELVNCRKDSFRPQLSMDQIA